MPHLTSDFDNIRDMGKNHNGNNRGWKQDEGEIRQGAVGLAKSKLLKGSLN